MHGQRSRRNEGDKKPERKRAGYAVAIKGPATSVEHERREVFKTPVLFQRASVRCDALEPAFHGFCFTPPERPLCQFRDACTRLRDHLGNQWLVAGAKSTV